MKHTIEVRITGERDTGKTTVAALVIRALRMVGLEVEYQGEYGDSVDHMLKRVDFLGPARLVNAVNEKSTIRVVEHTVVEPVKLTFREEHLMPLERP